ncbi:hypothetical protein GQ53DRAFT_727515 [Thozetella sp. PMI_491]|nr:hypothetical protein GQ53DRAFT_727515 [Thozetella sp. PMI_491]
MSILALSSLHRSGLQSHAVGTKTAAIRYLASSARTKVDRIEGLRHVAAGILLCSYEIQCIDNTTTQWCWYLCGAGHIVDHLELDRAPGGDGSVILDWFSHHAVFARFSLRHWNQTSFKRRPQSGRQWDRTTGSPAICRGPQKTRWPIPPYRMSRLLMEVFDHVLQPSDPDYHSQEHIYNLRRIESQLQDIKPSRSTNIMATTGAAEIREIDTDLELYRLSALIYLERASYNLSSHSPKLTSYIEDAFEILSGLHTCKLKFPLFILGCEAQSDERRKAILGLIKDDKHTGVSRLGGVRRMIQAVWVQDDLEPEHVLDYSMKLNAVINAHLIVPCFA